MKGYYDLHVHTGPSIFTRRLSDYELGQQIINNEIGGAVIKAHEGDTTMRAFIVNSILDKKVLYGSITLNSYVGGLNLSAVELSLKMDCNIVWFPTVDARNHRNYYEKKGQFNGLKQGNSQDTIVDLVDEKGNLKKEVIEILQLVKQYDSFIATGHISVEDIDKIIDESKKIGFNNIIITHPESAITKISPEKQKEYARLGLFIEKSYLWTTSDWGNTIEELAYNIQFLGSNNCIITTDFGQKDNNYPYIGFNEFVNKLLQYGIKEKEIEEMSIVNPKRILKII